MIITFRLVLVLPVTVFALLAFSGCDKDSKDIPEATATPAASTREISPSTNPTQTMKHERTAQMEAPANFSAESTAGKQITVKAELISMVGKVDEVVHFSAEQKSKLDDSIAATVAKHGHSVSADRFPQVIQEFGRAFESIFTPEQKQLLQSAGIAASKRNEEVRTRVKCASH